MRNTHVSAISIVLLSSLIGLSLACSRHSSDDKIAKDIQDKVAADPETKDSTAPANELAKGPLQTAVMQSGDFDFYPSRHEGCWSVHVISLPVSNTNGKHLGYAISHTVTDPQNVEIGHALTFGPDQDIFSRAMRKAAADAIRNIRYARGASISPHAMQE